MKNHIYKKIILLLIISGIFMPILPGQEGRSVVSMVGTGMNAIVIGGALCSLPYWIKRPAKSECDDASKGTRNDRVQSPKPIDLHKKALCFLGLTLGMQLLPDNGLTMPLKKVSLGICSMATLFHMDTLLLKMFTGWEAYSSGQHQCCTSNHKNNFLQQSNSTNGCIPDNACWNRDCRNINGICTECKFKCTTYSSFQLKEFTKFDIKREPILFGSCATLIGFSLFNFGHAAYLIGKPMVMHGASLFKHLQKSS